MTPILFMIGLVGFGAAPPVILTLSEPLENARLAGVKWVVQARDGKGRWLNPQENPAEVEPLTALAVLALLTNGHGPDDPIHGEVVRGGVEQLLAFRERPPRHSTPITTYRWELDFGPLALVEAFRQSHDHEWRDRLPPGAKAYVDVLLALHRQRRLGAYVFNLAPRLQGLRLAKTVFGAAVPDDAFERGGGLIRALFMEALTLTPPGPAGFRYNLGTHEPDRNDPHPERHAQNLPNICRNGSGALGLYYAGQGTRDEARRAMASLFARMDVDWTYPNEGESLGLWYGVQAAQIYSPEGWRVWWERVAPQLHRLNGREVQAQDGSFKFSRDVYVYAAGATFGDEHTRPRRWEFCHRLRDTVLTVATLGLVRSPARWVLPDLPRAEFSKEEVTQLMNKGGQP